MRVIDAGGDLAAQGIDLRLWLVDLEAAPFDDVPSQAQQQRAARFERADDARRYLDEMLTESERRALTQKAILASLEQLERGGPTGDAGAA